MALVKVWNDNKYQHTEMFKGDKIHIPAGGFIEMDWFEAMEFRGQFTGIKLLGDDTPDPEGFKMIRVEQPAEPVIKDDGLICHANGEQAVTREDLANLLERFGHMRAAKDPSAESATQTARPDQYADLLKRIAELESKLTEKRKPGRPKLFKKEAVG